MSLTTILFLLAFVGMMIMHLRGHGGHGGHGGGGHGGDHGRREDAPTDVSPAPSPDPRASDPAAPPQPKSPAHHH